MTNEKAQRASIVKAGKRLEGNRRAEHARLSQGYLDAGGTLEKYINEVGLEVSVGTLHRWRRHAGYRARAESKTRSDSMKANFQNDSKPEVRVLPLDKFPQREVNARARLSTDLADKAEAGALRLADASADDGAAETGNQKSALAQSRGAVFGERRVDPHSASGVAAREPVADRSDIRFTDWRDRARAEAPSDSPVAEEGSRESADDEGALEFMMEFRHWWRLLARQLETELMGLRTEPEELKRFFMDDDQLSMRLIRAVRNGIKSSKRRYGRANEERGR